MKKWIPWTITTIAIATVAVGVGWAGATVFRPAEDPLEVRGVTYATVAAGHVEASVNLNTVAAWEPTLAGSNQATGTVTSVQVNPGDEVTSGMPLYSVDLRPVVIAEGEIPSFRSISIGAKGDDVAQLQTMLSQLGFYLSRIDGNAEAGTEAAIKSWQRALGLDETGVVGKGDVVYVPSLPARVALDTERVARGLTLVGGEQVVRSLPQAPVFRIPLTDAQAQRIQVGTQVRITSPSGANWSAQAGEQQRDNETQTVNVTLSAEGSGPICEEACAEIPVTGEAQLVSRVITVPRVEGLVIPSAALVTNATGETFVTDEGGTDHAVKVTASASGMSVVEGVREGLKVIVSGRTL